MCAARRTTSTRLTRLAAKASPYHSAVTLYDARDVTDSEAQAGPSTPRRPRHVKQEPTDPETPGLDVPSDTRHGRTVSKNTKPTPRQKSVKPDVPDSDVSRNSPKKPTSKTKAILQRLDVPQPAPAKWADAYAAIKEMRSRVVAPVDTMGCDQAQLKERDPKVGLDILSPLHHRRIPLSPPRTFSAPCPFISARSFHGVTHSKRRVRYCPFSS
jgi:endonuclease-3